MSATQHVGTFELDLSLSAEELRDAIATLAEALNCSDLPSVRLARHVGLRPVLRIEVTLMWPDDKKEARTLSCGCEVGVCICDFEKS